MYGKELILDLYGCDVTKFTRQSIEEWLRQLCELIDMKRTDLHFWDYDGVPEAEIPYDQPHLMGRTAVQFIMTSNITTHTLEIGECYINLFSCKDYDSLAASSFTVKWFGSNQYEYRTIIRGMKSKCDFKGKE